MGEVSVKKNVRWLLVAGIAGIVWFAAAPSPASAGSYNAMNVSPQIASDNHRYVSFQKRNRIPYVLDTFTGKLERIKGAYACHPRDIGGDRVLMICPHKRRPKHDDTGFRARVASVHGGPSTMLPHSRRLHDAFEIGKVWVSVGYHPDNPPRKFVNWQTGIKRTVRHVKNGRDLDSKTLKPLKLQKFTPKPKGYPPEDVGDFSVCRGENVVVTEFRDDLTLWWSKDRSVRIGKGGFLYYDCEWYDPLRIGPEAVAWSVGPAVHAYNYRTGQSFDRRFGKAGSRITPVRDGVVIARKIRNVGKFRHLFKIKLIRF